MRVLVVAAGVVDPPLIELEVAPGTTVGEAIGLAAQADARIRDEAGVANAVGIWGHVTDAGHPLREGDRVELYRPIQADAKALRRARASDGRRRKL